MNLLAVALAFALIGTLVAVNVWYRRERARMSAEERAKNDEEMERESSIW